MEMEMERRGCSKDEITSLAKRAGRNYTDFVILRHLLWGKNPSVHSRPITAPLPKEKRREEKRRAKGGYQAKSTKKKKWHSLLNCGRNPQKEETLFFQSLLGHPHSRNSQLHYTHHRTPRANALTLGQKRKLSPKHVPVASEKPAPWLPKAIEH